MDGVYRMLILAPKCALLHGLRWQRQCFKPICSCPRYAHLRKDSIPINKIGKGAHGEGLTCCLPLSLMPSHHARPYPISSRDSSLFRSALVSWSIRRNQTISCATKRAQNAAQPRYVMQQNLAKCARDAEASNSRFPSKESLKQVELILG